MALNSLALNFNQTSDHLFFSFRVLGLQVCDTIPTLCHDENQTQDFKYARPALYRMSHIIPLPHFNLLNYVPRPWVNHRQKWIYVSPSYTMTLNWTGMHCYTEHAQECAYPKSAFWYEYEKTPMMKSPHFLCSRREFLSKHLLCSPSPQQ